jgi:signal peptide peptidase SppA
MRDLRALADIASKVWALDRSYLAAMFAEAARGGTMKPVEARDTVPQKLTKGVAVVPIRGIIERGMWGEMFGTSPDAISESLDKAARSERVSAVVLDIDSPGGEVSGISELATQISAMDKPTYATTSGQMASAAYWLGAQADAVVASRSASVGSVGVYTAHENLAGALEKAGVEVSLVSAGANKTEGNPFEPLGEDARAHVQSQVDQYYSMFVSDIARGRGIPVQGVEERFGQGRSYLGEEARSRGMVDFVSDAPMGAAVQMAGARADDRDARLRSLDLQKQKSMLGSN